MTLDQGSKVRDLVTETLDAEANVIWGARVTEEMRGKITVMTIITGVKSPWILGKLDEKTIRSEQTKLHSELGIDYA